MLKLSLWFCRTWRPTSWKVRAEWGGGANVSRVDHTLQSIQSGFLQLIPLGFNIYIFCLCKLLEHCFTQKPSFQSYNRQKSALWWILTSSDLLSDLLKCLLKCLGTTLQTVLCKDKVINVNLKPKQTLFWFLTCVLCTDLSPTALRSHEDSAALLTPSPPTTAAQKGQGSTGRGHTCAGKARPGLNSVRLRLRGK